MGEKNVVKQVFSELTKASKFSERCASLLRFLLEHDTKANEILVARDIETGRRQDTPSPSSGVDVPSREQVTKTWDHLLNRISDWACNIIKAAKIVMEAEVLKFDAKFTKDSGKVSKKRKAGDNSSVVSEKKNKTGNSSKTRLDCQICGGQHYSDKTGNIKTCWAVKNNHPQRNKEGGSWKGSSASKIWMDNGAQPSMVYGKMANGDTFVPKQNGFAPKQNKGIIYRNVSSIIASNSSNNANLTFTIPLKNREDVTYSLYHYVLYIRTDTRYPTIT